MQRALINTAILASFLSCLVLPVSIAAQAQEDPRIGVARRMLSENRPEAALADLDAILDDDDTLATAHYLRGIALGSLGRERDALDAFLRAVDLSPGWGEAHRLATIAALNTRNLPVAWEQAIKAHQAGVDISESMNQLLALEKAPQDLDDQLAAARIYVMPLNTEQLAAEQDNPWGVDVIGGGGGIPDPFSVSGSRGTGQGRQKISESQSQFYNLLMQMRRSLAGSRVFGVVQQPEMAQYLMVIEVSELDGGRLRGYLKMYDPRSGEEAYRRLLELTNINSLADLNRDVERYVDYMEEWLSERAG